MLVFAFDRDWTVDVNPHPNQEAVPLEWVRYLAHETDHAVYAIGNQDLAEEAAIPGVVDIVGRHTDDWEQWLGGKQPDGYYERFPTRRERLGLIADLHPDADNYVVVDDIDLSEVGGWNHYHAWEFVPAVKQGDIDSNLPWVREPVTDGGYPTSAGMVPKTASDVFSFLDNYDDAPAFEITYTEDGIESTDLLWTVSKDAAQDRQVSANPAIRCTPLSPSRDRFVVEVDALEMVSVVDPPPEVFTNHTETPTEEATALRRLAEVKPETIQLSSVVSLLDCDNASTLQQRDALQALQSIATVRPDECVSTIPLLRSLLAEDDFISPYSVLAILGTIGKESPADIAPATEDIVPFLDSYRLADRREAAACIASIATEYPTDVVNTVPELVPILEDGTKAQQVTVYALARIAREVPEAVIPAAEPLREVIVDESVSDNTRLSAIAALGRVADEAPNQALDIIEDVTRLFDADNHRLRNNAIALTYEVAAIHANIVEPYVDDIAAMLTMDDPYIRTNASGALARVADDFPGSVEHVTPTALELLADDDPNVRENACWLLGRLRVAEARNQLQDCAETDSNPDVRTRAQWALAQIEEI